MTETNYIYRPARPVDADQVFRLITAIAEEEGATLAAPDEISTEDIRARIRNATNRRNRLFFVATDDERIIGMVALESSPLRALQHIRTFSLAVDPKYRRRGIARELSAIALEWAFNTEFVHKIETQIRAINTAGEQLLKTLGFAPEGVLKRHTQLAGGIQADDILLARFVDDHAQNGS